MIRAYKNQDLNDVLNIWNTSTRIAHPFFNEAFIEAEKEKIEHIYIPNTVTFIYHENSRPVGFISMIKNEIGAIFVYPEHQSKGIGTALMNHVRDFHPELEVEVFEKNVIGHSFYDKYGFEEMLRHVHQETNEMLIRMKYFHD